MLTSGFHPFSYLKLKEGLCLLPFLLSVNIHPAGGSDLLWQELQIFISLERFPPSAHDASYDPDSLLNHPLFVAIDIIDGRTVTTCL